MRIILADYNNGDEYALFTSPDLVKGMRKLWENKYNELLASDEEISEEDTWFQEDMAQIVGYSGKYFAAFVIAEVHDI
jgi:hypothetical protein